MIKAFTTFEIAKMLNVDISTIIDWIDAKRILAFKTPGGHRRVKPSDLLGFLKKYEMPIPAELGANISVGLNYGRRCDDIVLHTANDNSPTTKKILVVDDEDNFKFISKALKELCVKIEFTPNGFAAGKRMAELNPDLLIIDMLLPDTDGFEVLNHLNGLEKKIKVLAVVAHLSSEVQKKIIKAGADDCLVKPFTAQQIREKVKKLLLVKGGNGR